MQREATPHQTNTRIFETQCIAYTQHPAWDSVAGWDA